MIERPHFLGACLASFAIMVVCYLGSALIVSYYRGQSSEHAPDLSAGEIARNTHAAGMAAWYGAFTGFVAYWILWLATTPQTPDY